VKRRSRRRIQWRTRVDKLGLAWSGAGLLFRGFFLVSGVGVTALIGRVDILYKRFFCIYVVDSDVFLYSLLYIKLLHYFIAIVM